MPIGKKKPRHGRDARSSSKGTDQPVPIAMRHRKSTSKESSSSCSSRSSSSRSHVSSEPTKEAASSHSAKVKAPPKRWVIEVEALPSACESFETELKGMTGKQKLNALESMEKERMKFQQEQEKRLVALRLFQEKKSFLAMVTGEQRLKDMEKEMKAEKSTDSKATVEGPKQEEVPKLQTQAATKKAAQMLPAKSEKQQRSRSSSSESTGMRRVRKEFMKAQKRSLSIKSPSSQSETKKISAKGHRARMKQEPRSQSVETDESSYDTVDHLSSEERRAFAPSQSSHS